MFIFVEKKSFLKLKQTGTDLIPLLHTKLQILAFLGPQKWHAEKQFYYSAAQLVQLYVPENQKYS